MKAKKKKTVKKSKRKARIIVPPNMQERGEQARKLAVQIEGTWEPGCLHLVGNTNAVVAALRPTSPAQAERLVAELKKFLTDLM